MTRYAESGTAALPVSDVWLAPVFDDEGRLAGDMPVPAGFQPEQFAEEPAGQAPQEIAPAPDHVRAEQLLRKAKDEGAAVLADVARSAVRRLLHGGKWKDATELFDHAERDTLADQLAATLAPAELLGMARVRLRAGQAAKHAETTDPVSLLTTPPKRLLFSESPTSFACFDEGGVRPLAPMEAIRYFKSLIPGLEEDRTFGARLEREGFALAGVVEKSLLERIQEIIGQRLETGQKMQAGPRDIEDILRDAGVHGSNPYRADAIFRTEMMNAYNAGNERERMTPDMQEYFPVWRYSNPHDSRSRPEHAARNGRYYPASVSFFSVRGQDAADAINCRCVPIEIDRDEWKQLQANGARFAEWPPG